LHNCLGFCRPVFSRSQQPPSPVYLYNRSGRAGDFYPTVSWGQFLARASPISTPVTLDSVGMDFGMPAGLSLPRCCRLFHDRPAQRKSGEPPFLQSRRSAGQRVFEANVGTHAADGHHVFPLALSPGGLGIVFGSGLFGADGWANRGYARVSWQFELLLVEQALGWQDAQIFPPEAYAQHNIMIAGGAGAGLRPVLVCAGPSGWFCLRRRGSTLVEGCGGNSVISYQFSVITDYEY